MSGVRDLADVGGLRGGKLVPMERPAPEPRGRARKAESTPRIFVRGDHVELAERLVEDMRAVAPFVHTEGAFMRYDEGRGLFTEVHRDEVRRVVMGYRGQPVRKGEDKTRALNLTCAAVDGSVSLASSLASEPAFFEAARPGVAFADCFVEVTAAGIVQREHSPDHRTRFAYDFAFVPHAIPAELLAFFGSVWRDDAPEDRAAKIALYQEYVGASMLGIATRYQRALVQVGDGANGKSVASAIIEGCMPPGSVCSIPPQDVGQEYRRAMLAGKLLNIVSELPESDILDSESWKAVVAGDAMTGREIHKSPFQFRPKAGHIYSANRLPGTTDHTAGFWRRMLVERFDRVFAEHEQEAGLADRILAQERPAMVSWFLAGAQRALAAGHLTIPPSTAAAIDGWKRASDQVLAFVEERCERLTLEAPTSTWCPSSKLYSAFRAWSEDNGHRPVASNKFAERMRLLGLGVTKGRLGNLYPVALKGGEVFRD
jgi:P4 family phage/plasmid primase-like protien